MNPVWSASTQLVVRILEQTWRARSWSPSSSLRFGFAGKEVNPPSRFFNQQSLYNEIRFGFKEPGTTGSARSKAQDLNQEAP
jgi:hypothetical protein